MSTLDKMFNRIKWLTRSKKLEDVRQMQCLWPSGKYESLAVVHCYFVNVLDIKMTNGFHHVFVWND